MDDRELVALLRGVASGSVSADDAAVRLKTAPFSDLGFAKVDHHRSVRQGVSEVVYGAGKTADQIAGIVASMLDAEQERIIITRIDADKAREVECLLSDGLCFMPDLSSQPAMGGADGAGALPEGDARGAPAEGALPEGDARGALAEGALPEDALGLFPDLPVFTYYDAARVATIGEAPEPDGAGLIVVATGGTSDIPVAEEAALTAEMLGNEVLRLYDVGVAGLHRLLAHVDELARARAVIAVAGMEGALASVVAGLVSCPVIAVPTSVGYGASFGGVAALLAMLNSCASGVSVVNIDNGFGAGYQANLINHAAARTFGED